MLEIFQPLHPKIIHFPIALLCTAALFELMGWIFRKEPFHKTSWHLFISFVISSPIAVLTGLWEDKRFGLDHPILERHELIGISLTVGSIIFLLIYQFVIREKSRHSQKIYAGFLALATLLILYTSHLGGVMVYEYGIGMLN